MFKKLFILFVFIIWMCYSNMCCAPQYIILDRMPDNHFMNGCKIIKIDTIKTIDGNMYKVWYK